MQIMKVTKMSQERKKIGLQACGVERSEAEEKLIVRG